MFKKSKKLVMIMIVVVMLMGMASNVLANSITIDTSLEDGFTIVGSIKTFDVFAKDANGSKIDGDDVDVTLNGDPVSYTWDDTTKTSYTLHLSVGTNIVDITAESGGLSESVSYTLYHTSVNPGDDIGEVTFCVESFTIGNGYAVEPFKVDIHEGENTAQILDRVLTDEGLKYRYTGSLTQSFYLSSILDGGTPLGYHEGGCTDPQMGRQVLNGTPEIPSILVPHLEENMYYYDPESYYEDELGEFDFTNGSGWMYCVNGVFPNLGFAQHYLSDGDVVRVQYTLAYGMDIGGFGAMGGGEETSYYPIADKDDLTELIAQINSGEVQLDGTPQSQDTYDDAINELSNLSPGQSVIDDAYDDLLDFVN